MNVHLTNEPKEMFPSNEVIKAKKLVNDYLYLENAPVGIDLKAERYIGINLDKNSIETYETIMHIILQISFANNYQEVKMCLFANEENPLQKKLIDAIKWIPNFFSDNRNS